MFSYVYYTGSGQHHEVHQALIRHLRSEPAIVNGPDQLRSITSDIPCIVLLVLEASGVDEPSAAPDAIREVRERLKNARIIVLGESESIPYIMQLMKAGACDYINRSDGYLIELDKSLEHLLGLAATEQVIEMKRYLDRRQKLKAYSIAGAVLYLLILLFFSH